MDTSKKFIITQDIDTAEELRKCGFQEIPGMLSTYIFQNSKTFCFSENIDPRKISYSNVLYF